METIVLGVEPRVIKKNAADKLRKTGVVPAVIYHKGEETVAVGVNELALRKLVHSAESHIIDLQFPDGKIKRSFIKDVQFHPVTDRIIHTDFQLFSADEIIELEVPVAVTGESAGVEKGGKLQIIKHALTIKGMPEHMPDHFVIDVTALESHCRSSCCNSSKLNTVHFVFQRGYLQFKAAFLQGKAAFFYRLSLISKA